MKRFSVALVLLGCLVLPAEAGHRRCVKQQAVVVQTGLIVTPFAIPVAVPVSPMPQAPVAYGYAAASSSKTTAAAATSSCGGAGCQCQQAAAATAQGAEAATPPAAPPGLALARQKCGTCHTHPGAKGGVRLFARHEFGPVVVEPLTAERRLECIDQIVQQKMPKGGTLSPAEIGELVQFFSAAPPAEKE